MKTLISGVMALGIASTTQAAIASTYYLVDEPVLEPTTVEYWTEPMTKRVVEKTVTIDQPVVIEKTKTVIKTQQYRPMRTTKVIRHRTIAAKPAAHRTTRLASSSTWRTKTTVRTIASKPVILEQPVYIEKATTKPLMVRRTIEEPVLIDRQVELAQPILVEKHHRHLLNFSLF
jgi:hypothetical protein